MRSLRAQLHTLARHFRVVALADLVEKVRQGGTPDREIALTFDDGLRHQVVEIYPLLRERALPATFFVCPGLVEAGEWPWTWESRSRLLGLAVGARVELARALSAPTEVNAFMDWIVTLDARGQLAARRALTAATPHWRPTDQEHRTYDVATWQDLEALDPTIATVGSHSTTHAMLTACDQPTLHAEVCGSREWIERRLGRPVRYFCYPNGLVDDTVASVVRANYDAAVTTASAPVEPGTPVERLPRLAIGSTTSQTLWRMCRPTS